MLNVSNAFNEAFKSDLREIKMRVTVNDVTYTDDDIISFNYNSSSIVGETYAIGSTFANSIKMTLCKIVEGLKQLDVVKPEMGIVLPDGSTEFVKLGTFLISEQVNPDRNENRTSLECTDKMLMLDDKYESKLSYPAEIRAVALEIANLAGVEVDKVSFGRLRREQIRKPEGYTLRQAIGLIAQFESGYATFDREGLLSIRQLTDKNFEVTPHEYFLKGLVKNELIFRPSGIRVKTGENEADVMSIGSDKGSVIKLENKLMETNLLESIYETISGINYYPYTLSWRGNPAIEAGDWLYITDLKGNKFKVPNLSYSLEYKGGLTAKSSVETVASNEVKFGFKSILEQTIEYVDNAIRSGDGSLVSYGLDEPPNPKEGDVWFKKVGPDTQIWVYERIGDTDKFEWVLKIDTAGDTEALEKTKNLEKEFKEVKEQAATVKETIEKNVKEAEETKEKAEEADKKAEKAIEEAKKIINKVDSVENNSIKTKQAIEETKAEAIRLQNDVISVKKEALENFEQVKRNTDRIYNHSMLIQKNSDSLSSKAEKNDIDVLDKKINQSKTEINQNANDIKLKADKSYVNVLNNTIEKHASEISQNADRIKFQTTKVDENSTLIAALKIENNKLSSIITSVQNPGKPSTPQTGNSVNLFTGLPNNTGLTINVINGKYEAYNFLERTGKQVELEIGQDYTISFDVEVEKSTEVFLRVSLGYADNSGKFTQSFMSLTHTGKPGKKEHVTKTFRMRDKDSSGNSFFALRFAEYSLGHTSTVIYKNIMLVKGEKELEWAPPDENMSDVSVDTSAIQQTIKGIMTTVSAKADKSEITQLSNRIDSVVKDVSGAESKVNQMSNQFATIVRKAEHSESLVLQMSDQITSAVKTSKGVETRVNQLSDQLSLLVKDPNGDNSKVLQLSNQINSVVRDNKDNKSEIAQLKSQVSIAVKSAEDAKATVSILKDNIQSTVTKGNVVSTINQSYESILIDAKKIYISGDTKIENAAISSAAIRDLSADKINTGTLDARKVRVVGIDAGNITTGTLDAIRIGARSITGDKLATDAIQVGLRNFGTNIKLAPNVIGFFDGGTLTGRITEMGQEFWYGSRYIGRMGEGNKSGDSSVRGIVNQLNHEGDYITWSYKESSYSSNYMTMLLMDPKGRFTGKPGIHVDLPLWVKQLSTPSGTVKFMDITTPRGTFPSLVHASTQSGVVFGDRELFFVHKDKIVDLEKITNLVNAIGNGTFYLTTEMAGNGTSNKWRTIHI